MGRWLVVGAVNLFGCSRVQGVVHQSRFARAGYAGDAGEQAHWKLHRDVLQVVAAGANDGDGLLGRAVHHGGGQAAKHIGGGCCCRHAAAVLHQPRSALLRHLDAQCARHIAARQGLGIGFNLCGGALRHHPTAMHTGTRAHVDAMVSRANHVLVVFHHQHAVANVAQMLQGVDEPVVVALVQTDAGFVQHIHHAGQARTDLRSQTDALRLAARQGVGTARKAQVGETHIVQKLQPVGNFTNHLLANISLVALQFQVLKIRLALGQGDVAHIMQSTRF